MSTKDSWLARLLSAITGGSRRAASGDERPGTPQQGVALDIESEDNFDFFNSLSGRLQIKLSKPAERIGNLLNERAPEDAQIVAVKLNVEVFEEDTEEFRPLTDEEWNLVVLRGAKLRLRGESDEAVEHVAPNGEYFTVADLIRAVEETERQARGSSDWLGGVDVHHCYFEGIEPAGGELWEICWGS